VVERVAARGRVGLVVIASLFEEVVQVLARDKLEHKQKETRALESAVKSHNIGVRRKRLVDIDL
jgi:hypothetical protein